MTALIFAMSDATRCTHRNGHGTRCLRDVHAHTGGHVYDPNGSAVPDRHDQAGVS